MVRVLGLLGSPRRGGNSEILLDSALQGASEAGAELELIRSGELDISGCIECNDCYETGECSISDDMDIVYEALERADRIVFASPIFFMGFPSQAKTIIDRTQCYWALRNILNKPFPRPPSAPRRYGAFIGVGATRGKSLFDGVMLTLKYFYNAVGMEPREDLNILIRGIDNKDDVLRMTGELEAAHRLGKVLAELD